MQVLSDGGQLPRNWPLEYHGRCKLLLPNIESKLTFSAISFQAIDRLLLILHPFHYMKISMAFDGLIDYFFVFITAGKVK